MSEEMQFGPLQVSVEAGVGLLRLSRPERANALDMEAWEQFPKALDHLGRRRDVRVVVLHAQGKHFCAGIDLSVLTALQEEVAALRCSARAAQAVRAFIEKAQAAFDAVEKLSVPVIAAVQGACVGAGVDLLGACDIRIASADARFSIKEVDMAIVPDVGTLQRLRHVIGYAALAELCYTGADFDAPRARELGLISRVCDGPDALLKSAMEIASSIAAKSPLAVSGIKRNLLWARDRPVADGLAYTAAWNAGMLMSEDLAEALRARAERRAPRFGDA